jgi:hypothetical protein
MESIMEGRPSGLGGRRANSGRKTISPENEKMKVRSIRCTDEEWEKCLKLGGSSWIRRRIAEATIPETP